MTNPQPSILYVTWRHSWLEAGKKLSRVYLVGRLIRSVSVASVEYEFCYLREVERAIEKGFLPLFEFRNKNEVYRSPVLFPTFDNRVMSPRRPDYANYLRTLHLVMEGKQDPMPLLIRSEGAKATDHIELFGWPKPDAESGGYETTFWLRGDRYRSEFEKAVANNCREGDELSLQPEPENEFDPNAVLIRREDCSIGYLPAYLVDEFHRLVELGATPRIFVEHLNGPEATESQRMLCKLKCDWPDGFQPFSSTRFEPLNQKDAINVSEHYDPQTLARLGDQKEVQGWS